MLFIRFRNMKNESEMAVEGSGSVVVITKAVRGMIILRIFRSLEPISSVLCPKLHFQRLSSGTNQSSSLLHSRTPESIHVRNFSVTRTSYSNDTDSEEKKPKIDLKENPTRADPAGSADWRKAQNELSDKDLVFNMQDPYKRQFEYQIRIGYSLLGAIIAVIAGISLCQNIRERYIRRMNHVQPAIRWEDFRREYLRKGRQVESIVFFPKYRVAEVYFRRSRKNVSSKDKAFQIYFLEELLPTILPAFFAEKPDLRFNYGIDKSPSQLKEEIGKFDKLATAPVEDGIYVVFDSLPSLREMIFLAVVGCSMAVLVASCFRRLPKQNKVKLE
ncbi:hypothetical protein Ddc_11173 [Ditylenchus destructor]|nr:hypothetical protein Ddc_11173 [Ditylenchus destructor]